METINYFKVSKIINERDQKFKKFLLLILSFLIFSLFPLGKVFSHCPLCTIGAGGLAISARWLGVSSIVIGLFIGAFGVSIGFWISRLLNKKFKKRFLFLTSIIIIISFLTTVFPIGRVIGGNYIPINIWIKGNYGSLLNRTYLINEFLIGSLIGALIVFFSPWLSKNISKLRKGNNFPFQTIILTFSFLIITAIIIELIKRF